MNLKPNYKFLNRIEVKGLTHVIGNSETPFEEEKLKEFKNQNKDNYYAALQLDDEIIFCSKLEINGKELWIPEPNPVHVYFYGAFRLVDRLEKAKIEFDKMADQLNGSSTIETYPYILRFFTEASQYFFYSFSSIEAFINQSIPENINYQSKKKGDIGKEEIEKGIFFKEKSTRLMKSIFSKSILQDEPQIYAKIWDLKEIRDSLIHLKTQSDKYRNKYREVLNRLLNFEYSSSIEHVEQYINFYKEDFIEHKKEANT